ncbi:S1 family peptidase [Streptomyces sp. NPDC059070]|uniref:S1 family peptidase n=1 Tax=Streptomyces sp. NPDC059070 TaxID=3346713 RepID=UPI0036C395F2
MRRPTVRALRGALALTAAATAVPLAAPALPASADSVVIGGTPAAVEKSPYAVALSSRQRFGSGRAGQFCGGAVVAPTKVVTAAHCLSKEVLGANGVTDLKVIAGRDKLRDTGHGREIAVRDTWVNPAYDPGDNAGDLAVLTLAEALPDSSVIGVAGPGNAAYAAGTAATVYGWGDTSGEGAYSSELRSTRVQVFPESVCERAYPGNSEGRYEGATMLCAGDSGGGHDACQGDSGGPLVARGLLIGLVSWGSGCGLADRPGVYTRMSAFTDPGRGTGSR